MNNTIPVLFINSVKQCRNKHWIQTLKFRSKVTMFWCVCPKAWTYPYKVFNAKSKFLVKYRRNTSDPKFVNFRNLKTVLNHGNLVFAETKTLFAQTLTTYRGILLINMLIYGIFQIQKQINIAYLQSVFISDCVDNYPIMDPT